ncbi:putative NADH dehydrogenase, FAD-containing subunit [Desulfamplus magnetovallimortis]|uniref:Putative NADH dehydrogenase, FAD-containing subunit n=1 Tax=Desulfamplus magnetovallimortis TaxID=1246637 RepID=A0A1W1H813_9BACT|nr:FAD-dependent oxidoreductase [Desulfamplus magnetovallimortis]SLM28617.1 putative NADH dehydrogenase, FAD-containing subunit [Desulfamplus magnetovallimortis]
MKKHLVLAGGGHAHMVTLANLEKFIENGHKVSVIGPSTHHYYSGMGPGMLGKTYTPQEIRFATKHVVEKKGGIFIEGKAEKVDPEKKILLLESGETIPYDVISFNSGSHVPQSIISEKDLAANKRVIFPVKPIERLMEAQIQLEKMMTEKRISISIIGGGPSSAEIAGNVWQLATIVKQKSPGMTMPIIKIMAGKRFMSKFPESVRKAVYNCITSRGIEIFERGYVKEVTGTTVVMESGDRHPSDFIFMALGVKPSKMFEVSGLPTGPDRGLLVNRFLQSTQYPEIFGGGDCIHFSERPLDKVGVYAVRENPVLFNNLMASLDNRPLQPFDPGGDYLLIFNLGGNYGVLRKKMVLFERQACICNQGSH